MERNNLAFWQFLAYDAAADSITLCMALYMSDALEPLNC